MQPPAGVPRIPYRRAPGSLSLMLSGFSIPIEGPSGTRSLSSLALLLAQPPLPSRSLTEPGRKTGSGRKEGCSPACLLSSCFGSPFLAKPLPVLVHPGSMSFPVTRPGPAASFIVSPQRHQQQLATVTFLEVRDPALQSPFSESRDASISSAAPPLEYLSFSSLGTVL